MKFFIKELINSMLGGICIAIGGTVYLESDNKYLGSLLFCVGLISICYMKLSLYTGQIGFIAVNHTQKDILKIFTCLIGNIVAVCIFGRLMAIALPHLVDIAHNACINKLAAEDHAIFIKGVMCGMLMYIAVWVFKNKQSTTAIFLAVPTFVIAGFEHSIADVFYFSVNGLLNKDVIIFIAIVLLGNTVGSLMLCALQNLANKIGEYYEQAEH